MIGNFTLYSTLVKKKKKTHTRSNQLFAQTETDTSSLHLLYKKKYNTN